MAKKLQCVNESLEFLFTKFDTLQKESDKQNEKIWKLEKCIEKLEEINKSSKNDNTEEVTIS